MRQVPLFLLMIVLPFLSYSQDYDYKKYMQLSYAEIGSLMYIEYNKGAFDKAGRYYFK